jgi:hypothetical protein
MLILNFNTFLMVSPSPYDLPVIAFFDFINNGKSMQKVDTKKDAMGIISPIPTKKNAIINKNM